MKISNMRIALGISILAGLVMVYACRKDDLMSEEEIIQSYLKTHDIVAEPTESGLYYIEYIEGSGDYPVYLDTVRINYTGSFVNGQIFDANTVEFTVGADQVIKGWEEGILYMREGGRALLIVPSKLGYGSTGWYSIPGNTVLVFQMHLVDIKFGPNHR
ncbi:MAG TPA: FKBP-type peptidyl-prolyl cis-trans isomerase [Bacteroidales bacterium]|nr:FKBP-type peptidyl-prolyl cis-trans isomerase [Bacteroidales bacterium]